MFFVGEKKVRKEHCSCNGNYLFMPRSNQLGVWMGKVWAKQQVSGKFVVAHSHFAVPNPLPSVHCLNQNEIGKGTVAALTVHQNSSLITRLNCLISSFAPFTGIIREEEVVFIAVTKNRFLAFITPGLLYRFVLINFTFMDN